MLSCMAYTKLHHFHYMEKKNEKKKLHISKPNKTLTVVLILGCASINSTNNNWHVLISLVQHLTDKRNWKAGEEWGEDRG